MPRLVSDSHGTQQYHTKITRSTRSESTRFHSSHQQPRSLTELQRWRTPLSQHAVCVHSVRLCTADADADAAVTSLQAAFSAAPCQTYDPPRRAERRARSAPPTARRLPRPLHPAPSGGPEGRGAYQTRCAARHSSFQMIHRPKQAVHASPPAPLHASPP